MPKVFEIPSASAVVFIRTRGEHCPPHVHVMNMAQNWEIKVFFYFSSDEVSFKIIKGTPKKDQLTDVLNMVYSRRNLCRKKWAQFVPGEGVCLINKHVTVSQAGYIQEVAANSIGSTKVAQEKYISGKNSVEFIGYGSNNAWQVGKCP